MLLRFSIKNFLSFNEKMTFDMFPNPKRTMHKEHIYKERTVPVLKQALVYGANGSGKTNLIKAVYFMQQVIHNKDFLARLNMSDWMHKPNVGTGEPMVFTIEFQSKEQIYLYELAVYLDGQVDETLKLSGPKANKKGALIYKREQSEFTTDIKFSKDVLQIVTNTLKVNPTSSLIAVLNTAPIISNEKLNDAIDWLKSKLVTVGVGAELPNLPTTLYNRPDILAFTRQFMTQVDVGLTGFSINKTDIDKWDVDSKSRKTITEALNQDSNMYYAPLRHSGLPKYNIIKEEQNHSVLEFSFQHEIGAKQVDLDIEFESNGTESVLRLMPALYAAIHAGRVVFVDEIEMSLHPLLIYEIIKLFAQSKTKGQLIFTTHQEQLMNQQELIRPDEIWFTEKHKGATNLYSLNDFKEHATKSLQNGYLQGRYGAIPQLNLQDINDEQSYGD